MELNPRPLRELLVRLLGGSEWAEWVAMAVVILLATLFIWGIWKLLDAWRKAIHRWIDAKDRGLTALQFQDQQIFSERQIARALHKGVGYSWVVVRLLLFLAWLNLTFTQFEWSRDIALFIFGSIGTMFTNAFWAVINYLPNLLIIVVVILISRLVMFAVHGFFEGVRLERITLPGFYPEWARTSYGLVRLLIIAMTLVIIFPYLPGSSSPAFQGLSIFIGVLLSLGSTSAVANVVAGIVITYTRAFNTGDRVRISDTEGDIIERSAFVTRIRTNKNEEVSIPNSMVMSDHIVNFSAQAKTSGVLLYTTVTIGYDVPWVKVHELLKEAAIRTDHILNEPEPFVLQTSLDDNYVAYELNACTRQPSGKQAIASEMHAHIQDLFRDAEIEILSPHYRAHRDGSPMVLPGSENPPTEVQAESDSGKSIPPGIGGTSA